MVYVNPPTHCVCKHQPIAHVPEVHVGLVWERGPCRECTCEGYLFDQAALDAWKAAMAEEHKRINR